MLRLAFDARSDVGLRREHNEDGFLFVPEHHAAFVFDGMGGGTSGYVAVEVLCAAVQEHLAALQGERFELPLPPLTWRRAALEALRKVPLSLEREPGAPLVEALLREANRRLVGVVTLERMLKGIGSTVAALGLEGDEVALVHSGDTRILRLRDGALEALTRDHTLANEWLGQPGAPDPMPHEYARILVRALGMEERAKLDRREERARPGDLYVLCTDGLHAQVREEKIEEVLRGTEDLGAACERLCALANEAGGEDNATVALARVEVAQRG